MSEKTYENILLWLISCAAPAQTLFVIIYGFKSPWYRSLLGRALFTKAFGLMLILDLSMIGHWWPTYPYQMQIGIVVISLVLVGSWMQLGALLRERYIHQPTGTGAFSRTPRGLEYTEHHVASFGGLTIEEPVEPVEDSVDEGPDPVDEPVDR